MLFMMRDTCECPAVQSVRVILPCSVLLGIPCSCSCGGAGIVGLQTTLSCFQAIWCASMLPTLMLILTHKLIFISLADLYHQVADQGGLTVSSRHHQ